MSTIRDITKTIARELRLDSWINAITGLGGTKDKNAATTIGAVRVLDLVELESLHQNGLAGRIVDLIPEEAIGTGIKTGSAQIDAGAKRLDVWRLFCEAWIWGRLYGRGALYLGCSDRCGRQDNPLADSMIGRGDLLYVLPIDGRDLAVARIDMTPGSMSYGEPSHYSIGRGSAQIHASRFVFFGGALTPYRVRRNLQRDYSVLQRPYDSLRAEAAMQGNVRGAFDDLSQAVFAIKDLTTMIANGQASVMRDRMEIVNLARSVAKAVVIDADMERFEHVGAANLTGVDPILARALQRVVSDTGIPATKLLGISPMGMNATGESDAKNWAATVGLEREKHAARVLRVAEIVKRNEGSEDPISLEWAPLDTPTENEKADRDAKQVGSDAIRISSGLFSPAEIVAVRYGGVTFEDIIQGRSNPDADAEAEAELSIRPNPGETWIDTEDGNRLQVVSVDSENVFFLDLDSSKPERQYRWRLASFTERSRKMEAPIAP